MIIGDTHGDWGSLNTLLAKHRPAIAIQVGDFGYWPKLPELVSTCYSMRKKVKVKTLKIPFGTKLYFCDGNHEDHDSLDAFMRGKNWRIPHMIWENVYYCPRGSTLTLPDGRNVLFFGGADSIDKMGRTPGLTWFPQEVPRYHEVDRALSLETPVHIVVSHTVPNEWLPDEIKVEKIQDPTRSMLSAILEKHKPTEWYSGHWHRERRGVYEGTRWLSLDYSDHHYGRWWVKI